MTTCDRTSEVHAYHDGELSPAESAAFEAHLAECGGCREMLEEIRRVSRQIGTAPLPLMPAGFPARLRDAFVLAREARERGLRKLTGWMTAAAAAVLVF